MRMSCNGCRFLRKGCSENCSIRSCLTWIASPESQANATVFLAKFYGRTGLINLINVGPDHLRPAIFRSLLHESCGRMLNPIYSSVGLLWSGSWQLCQVAVDAVLKGEPVTPMATDSATNGQGPPIKVYDIRHISKEANDSNHHRKKYKTRRAKRMAQANSNGESDGEASHESSLSHQSEGESEGESNGKETESIEPVLKLGIEPVLSRDNDHVLLPVKKRSRLGVFRTCQV